MNINMETILEIIKFTLPSIMVVIAVWIMGQQFTKSLQSSKDQELRLSSQRKTLPLQLQAYERMAVFLERISLDMLLIKESNPALSAREFHQHLIETIRSEYEHNLSQQIYLPDETWKVISLAKENTIKMINAAFQQTDPKSKSIDLSKKIMDYQIETGSSPTQTALSFVKANARTLF